MQPNLQQNMFHIHDLMGLLRSDEKAFTVLELRTLIEEKFGAGATFASCSVTGMNSNAAIEFLLQRQKIKEVEPGKYLLAQCSHCHH